MKIAISALRRLVAGLRARGRQLGLAGLGLTALASSAMAEAQLEKTEIRYQGWAGQVTFIELADDLGYLAPLKLKWVGNTISGPQDIQTVVTGDIDYRRRVQRRDRQADRRQGADQGGGRLLRLRTTTPTTATT